MERQSLIPSFSSRKKKMVLVVKNYTKTSIEVSHPVYFCLIFWHWFINFVWNGSIRKKVLETLTKVSCSYCFLPEVLSNNTFQTSIPFSKLLLPPNKKWNWVDESFFSGTMICEVICNGFFISFQVSRIPKNFLNGGWY